MNRSSSALLLALGLIVGCAHAPPETSSAAPTGTPSSSSQATAPTRTPAAPPSQAPAPGTNASAGARLDPNEEITSRELASIPDPVPGGSSDAPANAPAPRAAAVSGTGSQALPAGGAGTSAAGSAAPSTGSDAPAAAGTPHPAAPSAKRSVWRVQIHASPALQEADRVAKDASVKLGTTYVLEYEGTLYKVRLGAFDTEDAAGDLRERAIRLGYAGAFRMREDAENVPSKE